MFHFLRPLAAEDQLFDSGAIVDLTVQHGPNCESRTNKRAGK